MMLWQQKKVVLHAWRHLYVCRYYFLVCDAFCWEWSSILDAPFHQMFCFHCVSFASLSTTAPSVMHLESTFHRASEGMISVLTPEHWRMQPRKNRFQPCRERMCFACERRHTKPQVLLQCAHGVAYMTRTRAPWPHDSGVEIYLLFATYPCAQFDNRTGSSLHLPSPPPVSLVQVNISLKEVID